MTTSAAPTAIWSVDPRNGHQVEQVARASSPDEVAAACRAAAAASAALVSAGRAGRAELLRAMAADLESRADDLVLLADRETALGEVRLRGELTRTIRQLDLFADVLDEGSYLEVTIDHAREDLTPPQPDLRRMLLPLGPVAVFSASNFPFAFSVAGGDTASALAAGCPVVVKAHSAHPALSVAVADVLRASLQRLGLPADVVALVHGRTAGQLLVQDPRITAVGFTGSESGGRALFDLAAGRPRPIPVYAEMGSLNPLVITPGALGARGGELVGQLAASILLGRGQFCTKPGLVLLPEGPDGDSFVDGLAQQMVATPATSMLTPGLRSSFEDAVATVAKAARVVATGAPGDEVSAAAAVLLQVQAAALGQDAGLLTECFGPASLVVRYRDHQELLGALAALPGNLTCTIHSEPDEAELRGALTEVAVDRAGRVLFDQFPTGVAVSWAQHHGGPYPATSNPLFTSVGTTAVRRFLRPVAYQNAPDDVLPPELRRTAPAACPQRVDGHLVAAQG